MCGGGHARCRSSVVAELALSVAGATAEPYAAVPTLALHLRLEAPGGERVQAVALRAQIRIEPQRRHYTEAESERLVELFGAPAQWGDSLRPFLWLHAATVVGAFEHVSEVELPVACTYDFEVSAARYLHGLDDGEVPLLFLFNGTIFRTGPGGLVVEPIGWHTECRYRMPVAVWRGVMDRYFPGGGWLRLRRETIDALGRFKAEEAFPTWDETVERLLKLSGGSP